MEDLTSRIRVAVGRTGLSVQKLADEMALNRSAVYQWLDGSTEPTPKNLFILARKAAVRPEWLLFGESPMRAPSQLVEACQELQHVLRDVPSSELEPILKDVIAYARFKRAG